MKLTEKKCVTCEGGVPPLNAEQTAAYTKEVSDGWQVMGGKKIHKEFTFADFHKAMAFVNKVADIANAEDHHPDIYIFYNKVTLELLTHAIGGLSENDFIVAAKVDELH